MVRKVMAIRRLAWLTIVSEPRPPMPTMLPGRMTVASRSLFSNSCSVCQRSRSQSLGASGETPSDVPYHAMRAKRPACRHNVLQSVFFDVHKSRTRPAALLR